MDTTIGTVSRAARSQWRPLARAATRTLAILGALALLAAHAATTARAFGDALEDNHVDFFTLLRSAEQLRAGLPLYGAPGDPNLNPPALAVAWLPLTALPPHAAYLAWNALALAAYVAALVLAAREIGLAGWHWWTLPALALALAAPGIGVALYEGQVAPVLALVLVLAWRLLRRDHALAAGVLIGILIAWKPFLAPLAAAFLDRRHWRGFAGLALGAAALTLAPLPIIGVSGILDYARTLLRTAGGMVPGSPNISALRLVTGGRVAQAGTAGWMLTTALCLAALVAVRARRPSGTATVDRDCGVLVACAILASPLGWVYYTPLLIPAAAGLLAAWPRAGRFARLAGGLGLAILVIPYGVVIYAWWPLLTALMPVYSAGVALLALGLVTSPPAVADSGRCVPAVAPLASSAWRSVIGD